MCMKLMGVSGVGWDRDHEFVLFIRGGGSENKYLVRLRGS